jgi:hypothetical protein
VSIVEIHDFHEAMDRFQIANTNFQWNLNRSVQAKNYDFGFPRSYIESSQNMLSSLDIYFKLSNSYFEVSHLTIPMYDTTIKKGEFESKRKHLIQKVIFFSPDI